MPPVETIADELLGGADAGQLARLEHELMGRDALLEERIAVKLARSKAWVRGSDDDLSVSFVFAMYKESERILTSEQHRLGEDFVNRKVEQLRWLFDGDEAWNLVMVDDGCPDGSGEIAQRIVAAEGLGHVARVLFLAEAIENRHPVVAGMTSTDESRKGAAIQLGMYEAGDGRRPNQIIAYTDADLSTNLGQAGLLAEGLAGGAVCAAGSRREPTSVVVKGGARDHRGKVFIYLWKQMLPQLEVIDSQCGFKAFRGEAVPDLVTGTIEKRFAFDLELLLRCRLSHGVPAARVPVAWVDSEEASTTTDLEPYLPMLRAVAAMYRMYSPDDDRAKTFVELIEAMTESDWARLVAAPPQPIVEADPNDFSHWAGIDADDIAALL